MDPAPARDFALAGDPLAGDRCVPDQPGGDTSAGGRARTRRVMRATRALRSRADILAVISAGGALGSLARWGLTLAWPVRPGGFAWATMLANVPGALLLGVLMVFVLEVWPPSRYARPFLGVGVLGGYTTFSTAMLDTRALFVAGYRVQAVSYLFGGLLAGLLAVWLGMATARALVVVARMRADRRRDAAAEGVTPRSRERGEG